MAVDELALLQGPGGEREGFGRRCPWLEPLRNQPRYAPDSNTLWTAYFEWRHEE